ncbi:hypothetical protein [Comamonas aquatica]|uniref:hypothetical protein n=1 Tax=Comamonas aquatica TaxID=225991 RepID=UPI0034D5649F
MKRSVKFLIATTLISTLVACGKVEGISDEEYSQYKLLAAPKILYSCKMDGVLNSEGLKRHIKEDASCERMIEDFRECQRQALLEADLAIRVQKLRLCKKPDNYSKYEQCKSNASKILEGKDVLIVDYVAGLGGGESYNSMLMEVQELCEKKDGKFKILESEK